MFMDFCSYYLLLGYLVSAKQGSVAPSFCFLWLAMKQAVVEVGKLKIGDMRNSQQELLAFKAFVLKLCLERLLRYMSCLESSSADLD